MVDYPIGNGMWSIHNLNQETRNTVVLYGYNFRTDALPDMEREFGIADWIDPQTGAPAEGQSPPRIAFE